VTPGFYTTSLRVTDATNTTFDRPINWTVVNTAPLAQIRRRRFTVGTIYSYTFPSFWRKRQFLMDRDGPAAGIKYQHGRDGVRDPDFGWELRFRTVTIADLTNNTSIGFSYTFRRQSLCDHDRRSAAAGNHLHTVLADADGNRLR